jgi:hypothetical protein
MEYTSSNRDSIVVGLKVTFYATKSLVQNFSIDHLSHVSLCFSKGMILFNLKFDFHASKSFKLMEKSNSE